MPFFDEMREQTWKIGALTKRKLDARGKRKMFFYGQKKGYRLHNAVIFFFLVLVLVKLGFRNKFRDVISF